MELVACLPCILPAKTRLLAQTFLQLLGGGESLVESHSCSNHGHVVIVGFVHDLRWNDHTAETW